MRDICCRQFQDADSVLSRQPFQGGRLALDLLLAPRIDVENVQVAPQRVGGFLGIDHGFRHQLRRREKLRVRLRGGAQCRVCPAQ